MIGATLAAVKTQRAAVIPYMVRWVDSRPQLYFLLAQDRATSEWTDFGGGVKKFEYALETAYREFREESKEIFHQTLTCNSFASCVAVMDHRQVSCTIFVPLPTSWYDHAIADFKRHGGMDKYRHRKCYNEIRDIDWFSQTEFLSMIHGHQYSSRILWARCRHFYRTHYMQSSHVRENLIRAYHYHYPCRI